MHINERFNQLHAVAVRIGGVIKLLQWFPIALTVGLADIGPVLFEYGGDSALLRLVSGTERSLPQRATPKLKP